VISIKTTSEIDIMRKSGRILHELHAKIQQAIKPGRTTLELDAMAEKFILENDAIPSFKGYNGFPATICTAVNNEVVHGIPSDYVLKNGDIIGVDSGVCYKGLHTDSCNTWVVGDVSDDISYFLKIVKKSLMKGIKMARPGNRIGDISNIIQKTIEQSGYGVVRELTGHGIGYNLHEDPEILNYGKKGKGLELKSGMTICIEPIVTMGDFRIRTLPDDWTIVTKDGSLSGHFEHTILITAHGNEVLT